MTDTEKYMRLKTCNRYMVIKERWPPAIHLAQLGKHEEMKKSHKAKLGPG